jgi:hypothetical protein
MDKLTEKERALIAAARREAEARKSGTYVPAVSAAAAAAAPAPAAARAIPAAAPAAQEKPKPTPAERLAQLMAAERAETELKKKKMRRYGIMIPGAILAVALLSLLRALRRR